MRFVLLVGLSSIAASCGEPSPPCGGCAPGEVCVEGACRPSGLDAGARDAGTRADASPEDAATDAGAPADGGADAAVDAGPACEQPELHGDAPPLARLGACGRLEYGRYANQGQSNAVHRLPDFSYAGYRGGGVALPDVAVAIALDPESGDQRARIQAAIDEVSARPLDADGRRGAVLLRRGTWRVGDTLTITASGVVLRGEGQGTGGTVLVATRRAQHTLVSVRGPGSGLGEVAGSRTRITTPYVPVGARTFEVESADGLAPGVAVAVLRTPNATWIDELGMDAWGWTPESYAIAHERTIVAVEGTTVTVDVPIVDTMEARYGGGALFRTQVAGRIEEVGVEELRLVSEHAGPDDEEHAWTAVRLERARHSWVRRVSAVHFGFAAVSFHAQASFNTVEDCAMLAPISLVTGSRRYSFNVAGGVGNFFQRCYSEDARHDFASGARVTGPHVWLDGYSTRSTNDDGPHHRWATGLLLDNTMGRWLHVENRQSSGTGHGWSGAQVLFWNGLAAGIRCDAPRGAMNYAVGCYGEMREGGWAPAEPFGIWESHNRAVTPRSLYLAQLRDRLGDAAVEAVTLPAQREGRIWGLLAGWAGEGRLEDATPAPGDPTCATGIAAGGVCCAAACGACGGTGCGARPGGGAACCTGTIAAAARSCQTSLPPCVL
ncbi:MAG: hypothetical protein KF729_32065 [Sandaracinaceae bacterium]|nr:hypothetical protein [Sandaracinaceae bacterium]